MRGAGGVQPPAVRRRCSRTRPRTLTSGRSWPASAPTRTSTRASASISTPAASRRWAARRSRFARRAARNAPRKAGSKARVSSRSSAGGVLRPALAQGQGEEPREGRVAVREPAPREDRRRPRAQRLAAQHGQVGEGLGGRAVPRCRDVGVRGADDRERPGAEPARVALAEEREPPAALVVAGPERLRLVEVAPVHLVEDLQEPGLLALEEREEPEGPARLALGAAESRDGGRPGAGPGLVPAQPLLVDEHAEHLGHRDRGALVGEEESPAVGQGVADRPGDEGQSPGGAARCRRRPPPPRAGGRGRRRGAPPRAGAGRSSAARSEPASAATTWTAAVGHGPILPQSHRRRGAARGSCGIVPEMAPDPSWPALDLFFKSHPWHGVAIGPDAPRQVTVFVEIVPSDTVKYELDKDSGLLKVDRPQLYSNVCPSPYGFVPRTLCGAQVAALAEEKTGRGGLVGDDDPLDILLFTEKDFTHGNILVQALPIGGLGMLDGSEVDDKIVAVMVKDAVYGGRPGHLAPADPPGRPPQALLPHLQAGAERGPPGLRAHARLRPGRGIRGDPPEPGRLPGALRRDARADSLEGVDRGDDRRHRRGRVHRQQLRAARPRAHGRAGRRAGQAHLRRQPREPGRRGVPPALRLRAGGHRRPRGGPRAAPRAPPRRDRQLRGRDPRGPLDRRPGLASCART